jgi:hypothetical protein
VEAFLSGYRSGLLLAAVLVMAGGVTAFAALRRAHRVAQLETQPEREDLVLAG